MNHNLTQILHTVLLFLTLFATPVCVWAVELDVKLQKTLTSLPPITGERVSADDVKDKIVVVAFFASWCPPCLTEFTHLNELKTEFQTDNVTIIAINVFEQFNDNDTLRLAKFIDKTNPTFFVVKGSKEIRETFDGVKRIPTLFIFDRSGKPVMHFIHKQGSSKTNANTEELRKTITKALHS